MHTPAIVIALLAATAAAQAAEINAFISTAIKSEAAVCLFGDRLAL